MNQMLQTGRAVAEAATDMVTMGYKDLENPERAQQNPAEPFQKAAVDVATAYTGAKVPKPIP